MADAVSDSDTQAVRPPPKRRRILDPSAIIPVPVYSNKVNSSLQLKPTAPVFTHKESTDDRTDDSLWLDFTPVGTTAKVIFVSDSEEDEEERVEDEQGQREPETIHCPSPPPPESPVQKQSSQVRKKLYEFDMRLQAVNSLLSPMAQGRTKARRHRGSQSQVYEEEQEDEDVIIVTPNPGSETLPSSTSIREIPLKIRCRTDIHKIHVLSSTPLHEVLTRLSIILNVQPPRLLLLKEEVELPTDSTVGELGLGIADIIECVVMAAEDKGKDNESSSIITVRLQSKDRDSSQEFSLHRNAALGSIFSRYLSKMSTSAQKKVRFHFDGLKVTPSQTPAQLDMEDGDIIEVWI